jgi:hypothetical protein
VTIVVGLVAVKKIGKKMAETLNEAHPGRSERFGGVFRRSVMRPRLPSRPGTALPPQHSVSGRFDRDYQSTQCEDG